MASDTEGGERPVREQLQKAHIDPLHQDSDVTQAAENKDNGDAAVAGQASSHQRGSLDETRDDGHGGAGGSGASRPHTRKRSRDSTAEEAELNDGQRKVSGERSRDGVTAAGDDPEEPAQANGALSSTTTTTTTTTLLPDSARPATPEATGEKRTESAVEAMASPKSKRSRLQSTNAASAAQPEREDAAQGGGDQQEGGGAAVQQAGSTATIPSGSGFANSSMQSPFGALAGSKPPSTEPLQTSASAFASSGFSALSGTQSGFGQIGKSSSGFGSGGSFAKADQKADETSKPAPGSVFGGNLGQKGASGGFASSGSGFGKLGQTSGGGSGSDSNGQGFGNGNKGGSGFYSSVGGSGFGGLAASGGLTSFASGKPSSAFGSSARPTRAFGALADDEKEGADETSDDEQDAANKSPLASAEEDRQDERFYAQDLETGEEDETTQYSCRAKLYNFATLPDGKKEWRERGLGVLRLNLKKPSGDEAADSPRARFLMRAEGSHRVVLNTPIKKEIKFGDPHGEAPQGGYMYFMGAVEDGSKLELLQLKMRQQFALELHEKISELQAEM